jgi:hypothetical protein
MRKAALPAIAALVLAASAAGKGSAPFDRATAHPGDVIAIGGGLYATGRVDAWLLPLAQARRWWPSYNGYGPTYGPRPHLRAALALGSIPDWSTIRVRVPRVAPGRYVLAYWLPSTGARWTSARPDLLPVAGNVLRVR